MPLAPKPAFVSWQQTLYDGQTLLVLQSDRLVLRCFRELIQILANCSRLVLPVAGHQRLPDIGTPCGHTNPKPQRVRELSQPDQPLCHEVVVFAH